MVADPEIAKLTEELRITFQLILAGRSEDDIELQDKILDAILEEVGGWKVERFCEQDMAEFTNVYLQRLGHKHINFVWAGGYIGSWMQFGTPDWVKGYVPTAAAGLERDAAGGKLVQCGGDAMMGSGSGIPLGGATGLEQFVSYDPDDYESTVAGIKHMEDAVKDAGVHRLPARQGVPLPADRLDRRADLGRARARQAAAGVPLPAQDQGGVRPEQRGRPHVPDAAGGLRGRQLTESPDDERGGLSPGPPPCLISQDDPMKSSRWPTLVASVVAALSAGLGYSWSVLLRPMAGDYGWSAADGSPPLGV